MITDKSKMTLIKDYAKNNFDTWSEFIFEIQDSEDEGIVLEDFTLRLVEDNVLSGSSEQFVKFTDENTLYQTKGKYSNEMGISYKESTFCVLEPYQGTCYKEIFYK